MPQCFHNLPAANASKCIAKSQRAKENILYVSDKPQRQNPSPNKRQMPMKPSGRPAQIGSGAPPKPKDPLKMTGQKSNIKLTLIKVLQFIPLLLVISSLTGGH